MLNETIVLRGRRNKNVLRLGETSVGAPAKLRHGHLGLTVMQDRLDAAGVHVVNANGSIRARRRNELKSIFFNPNFAKIIEMDAILMVSILRIDIFKYFKAEFNQVSE